MSIIKQDKNHIVEQQKQAGLAKNPVAKVYMQVFFT
jgi:hypothetical protein